MPELPDVAVFCKTVEISQKKSIKKIRIYRNRMFKTSDQSLRSNLEGSRFIKRERHGKYLFIGTDNDKWLVIHFGMTGNIYYNDAEAEKSILVIDFKEGMKLSITSTRKLGRVDLTKDIEKYIKSLKLGPDAMKAGKEKFVEIMGSSKGMIKNALMNQNKIAGIGNIYADEILYQTKVHPKKKLKNISEETLSMMHKNMICIFDTAIDNNAIPENMPESYLIHRRKEGERCPGGEIKKIKISGRPTYFCPEVQK